MNITHRGQPSLPSILACSLATLMLCFSVLVAAPLKIDEPAPDFTLKDQSGSAHTLSQYKGKIVVLEWTSPTCPFVVRHYTAKTMTSSAKAHPEVVWLTVNSSHFTKDKDNRAWAEKNGVRTVLNDSSGSVGALYGARTTPHMYIIDVKGALAYQGAIDNDPYGENAQPINYVMQAIKELKAGRRVSQADTKPYGCSVKYKR